MQRDADGIALGGVRTPPVDVPVRVLSGVKGPSNEVICLLLGSTTPLPAERLAELYPSREEFEQRYDAAVDEAIDAGLRPRGGPRGAPRATPTPSSSPADPAHRSWRRLAGVAGGYS